MRVQVITETLSNKSIAIRQLDRAIQLFLDEEDYVSALTLAGAAEEILGKLLNAKGRPSILDELIDGSLALNDIKKGSPEERPARKKIASTANDIKNRMKHYREEEETVASVDFFAADMIDRAISNYHTLTFDETEQMQRFKEMVLMAGEG